MYVLLYFLAGACGFIVAISLTFMIIVRHASRKLLFPYCVLPEESLKHGLENNEFDQAFLDKSWEELEVVLDGTHSMTAHILINPSENQGTILFLHGITWTWHGMLKYAKLFYKKGYSLILADLPGHGKSSVDARRYPSYGYYEKFDVQKMVSWMSQNKSELFTSKFGVVGESMGAATAIQYAALAWTEMHQETNTNSLVKPDFVIADCPFDSAYEELRVRLIDSRIHPKLAGFVCEAVDMRVQKLRGFSLRDANPSRAGENLAIPLLLIHGWEDSYVPQIMSARILARRSGLDQKSANELIKQIMVSDHQKAYRKKLGQVNPKHPNARPLTRLLYVPSAKHAASVNADPELWEQEAFDFIDSVYSVPGSLSNS